MSRKNSILIIITIAIIILGGLIFLYFSNNANNGPITATSSQNPFGNTFTSDTIPNTTTSNGNQNINTSTSQNLAKLIKLYQNPVSGSILFADKSNQDVIRFVDRAKGNVYEYVTNTQTGEPVRLTNTTIPKIQEAVWVNSGKNLVYRYLNNDTDVITSFLAKISTTSSTDNLGEITGSFITPDIKQIATNPLGTKLFRLLNKSGSNGTFGTISSFDGTGEKQVFDSPVLFWNISWPTENVITFTTKPSYKYPGYLFFFNPQTGAMDRILGDMNGLSTLTNTNASLVAYSINDGNSFAFNIYDVKNKTNKDFQVNTLADKCVWGLSDTSMLYCAIPNQITSSYYPDAWYQGVVSFSDNIWSINTTTGEINLVYQVGIKENADIDAYNLKISPTDKYLTFMNKNDLSLWMLQL